jgi:hypothetical protein
MPRIISPEEKLSVIGDWLDGETRENIAVKHNIGSGTVYNIVQEWSNRIGFEKAEVLRVLAVKLKKNGITAIDCAKGFRMVMVFKKYGIQEEDEVADRVTYFLKEIYLKCQEVNLTPQKAFVYIYDIINFSKEISLSHIPDFMNKKTAEKERLEISIDKLTKKLKELEKIKNEKDQEIQNSTELAEKMSDLYNLFTIVKYKLDQHGIDMRNLNQFANCMAGIAKENYNVTKVIERMSDYDNLVRYIQQYKNEIEAKKVELDKLNIDINYYKGLLNTYTIKIDILDKLEIMGFGINELQILYDTLTEINRENRDNNKTLDEIKKGFFNDLKNYNEVIRLRNERDRLETELKNLEMLKAKERERYNSYPKVIQSIERLSNARIYENDIIKIDNILSMADTRLYKNKSSIYKQNLIDDLQKYGNLKLALKNLEDNKRKKINLKPKKKIQPQRQKQKRKNRLSTNKDTIQ